MDGAFDMAGNPAEMDKAKGRDGARIYFLCQAGAVFISTAFA
jgi:hypothetical protein